jgi:hypothetical protein
VPTNGTIETHARRLFQRGLTEKALAAMADDIARQANEMPLPDNLIEHIVEILNDHPEMSWDQALAQILS